MKITTIDLSGFGGEYENTCQTMLWNAVRYIAINKKAKIESKQYENVFGLALNEGEHGQAFDKAMREGIADATGAMHHAATNHALYIQEHGYKAWLEQGKQRRPPEAIYEFEYSKDFDLETI